MSTPAVDCEPSSDVSVHVVWEGSSSGQDKPVSEGAGQLYQVSVTIVKANGLYNSDGFLAGKSDPYVICQVPGCKEKKFQTRVIDNDLDPVWDHRGIIENVLEGEPLEFEVWDKDTFPNPDDFLGKVVIPSNDFLHQVFDGEVMLQESPAPGATITLRIEAQLEPGSNEHEGELVEEDLVAEGHGGSVDSAHSSSVKEGEIVDELIPSSRGSVEVEEQVPAEVKSTGAMLPPITVVWTTPLQTSRTEQPSIVHGYMPLHQPHTGHLLPSPTDRNLAARGHQRLPSQYDCNLIAAGHQLVSPMTFRFFKDPPPERQGTDPLAHKFGARDVPAEKSGKPGPPTPSSIASQIREVAAAQKRFREELEEVRNLANSNTHDLGVWKRSRGLEEPVTRQLGPSREHTTQSSAGRSVMSQTGNSKNGRPVLSWMGDKSNGVGTPSQRSLTARRAHGLHRAARTTGVSFGNRWFPSGNQMDVRRTADDGDEDFCFCIR